MLNEKKLKKTLFITFIISLTIIIIEAAFFIYKRYDNERKNVYYDNYNMTIKDKDNNLISVGSSYFKHSKYNKYTDGIEKGKLVKIDSDNNIVFEKKYENGIRSTFTAVKEYEDNYYVVGSSEYTEEQSLNNLRDALIIKYDKNGKIVWEKYYGVLANTRFTNLIVVEDGIVAIGTSIYENMEVGNHKTGGGIIVKYDFDGNEIWHGNHGGNKSGSFTNVQEYKGNYYVIGKDGADSGNLVKFNKDGEYVWHKNFSYTDSEGNQGIDIVDDKIYVVSSKKVLDDESNEKRITDNTDGIILIYDLDGEIIKQKTIGGSSFERITDIVIKDEFIYLVGLSASNDFDLANINIKEKDDEVVYSTFVLKYDMDLNLIKSNSFGGYNNDIFKNIDIFDDNLYISGLSNSKNGNIKTKSSNGKDYIGKIIKLDLDLKYEVIK